MEKITFTCETITPMFLAGADGMTPELRAPSIKGALRFWWRAMNGHLGLAELKEREAEIFGGTENRSKVILRVIEPINPILIKGKDLKEFKLDYLFFSFLHHKVSKEREGYDEGNEFSIIFQSRDSAALNEFIKSFWLLVFLGSLGTRCRRGLGAFKVKEIITSNRNLESNWKKLFIVENLELDIIKAKKNVDTNLQSIEFASLFDADIYFSPVGNEYSNGALGLLEDIMTDLRVSDEFTINDLPQKAAFGLPIMVRYPNSKPLELNLKKNERRASPLFISTYMDSNNKYRWIVTHFKGKFMPQGEEILLKKSGKEIRKWKQEDNSLIDSFIKELKDEGAEILTLK